MSLTKTFRTVADQLDFWVVLKEAFRRFLLPDVTWKLTFWIVGCGIGIMVLPTPVKVLVYNWLISIFNVNAGVPVTIPELSSGQADFWMGLVLILLGVIYNLFSRVLNFYDQHYTRISQQQVEEVDRELFKQFLNVLPSESSALELARGQDFGHTFHVDSTDDLESFLLRWRHPEFTFHTAELEQKKMELFGAGSKFVYHLAMTSEPLGNNRQSIVPPGTNDFNWPQWVEKEVQEANLLGRAFAKLHQDFVLLCKQRLNC